MISIKFIARATFAGLLLAQISWVHAESAAQVSERVGSGNPAFGNKKSLAENCQECHGEDGISTSVSVPKLAGQYADYLVKQLRNFQSGERQHPIMNAMAEGVLESDLADIAAFFASQKIMQGEAPRASLLAKDLFTRGDMSRNIVACKSCHGENGKGKFSVTESYPVIGGQHRIYLREQLLNWRKGARANSPSGVMNVIAKSLSDAELEALADYLSGL